MGSGQGIDVVRQTAAGVRDITEELAALQTAGPINILQRAVIVEILSDISLRTPEELEEMAKTITNPTKLKFAPRNSAIVRVFTNAADKSSSGDFLCYPFFPPHLTLPVKQGEQVWILLESLEVPQSVGFWMCRITEPDFVDDVNYTHGDRKWDLNVGKQDQDTSDAAKALEDSGETEDDADEGADEGLESPFIPGFPNGPAETKDTTTLAEAEAYEMIFTGSLAGKSFLPEPVPRFTSRPGDLVLQGSNNALICLGQDRGWAVTDRPDGTKSNATDPDGTPPRAFSGTIDLVAGRGRHFGDPDEKKPLRETRPRSIKNARDTFETDKNPTANGDDKGLGGGSKRKDHEENRLSHPAEGDPDFMHDAARVYISMNTDGDKNFDLDKMTPGFMKDAHKVKAVDGQPYIIAKSNQVRIVARNSKKEKGDWGEIPKEEGSIRIIRQDEEAENICAIILLPGGKLLIDAKTIVIGDGRDDQIFLGEEAKEPAVMGDELAKMLKTFCDTAKNEMGNQGFPLANLKVACETLASSLDNFKSSVTKVK